MEFAKLFLWKQDKRLDFGDYYSWEKQKGSEDRTNGLCGKNGAIIGEAEEKKRRRNGGGCGRGQEEGTSALALCIGGVETEVRQGWIEVRG
ncbi:uncharacterized protein MONOS_15599 [Monocercomonoides exilis]|uniref:uncharacterized protein n=1 Tax=Monocercomonoides exilis TaxID=2049356 RepID=UPI00355976CE|nr:hypothetical protein MONOS_15599 [Monocercomonoides exilis]|eukprot:MONOS_15599.1-p1 / transcript=MONOS_15599.1 / gene=MONOS_15599 / organism=Monocercomonoides_exilis_PA203 / gene_product=unspecified product / transcript_product=unspecified product / location=Mono_scaffold01283:8101-8441(+) / protein_length=91 / sequence_SO=supercontig / SO=protein_coding / is_pseudo=false